MSVTINGKPATAHSLLAALIDIHDDSQKNPPERRCYVESAWSEVLERARAFLAALAAPEPDGYQFRKRVPGGEWGAWAECRKQDHEAMQAQPIHWGMEHESREIFATRQAGTEGRLKWTDPMTDGNGVSYGEREAFERWYIERRADKTTSPDVDPFAEFARAYGPRYALGWMQDLFEAWQAGRRKESEPRDAVLRNIGDMVRIGLGEPADEWPDSIIESDS